VLLAVVAGVIVIDQVTKAVAVDHLGTQAHHVIGPFGLELTYNTGSAFSLLQGGSWPLFALDAILVVALIWVALRTRSLLIRVALGLIVGGALGNMIDRVARGHAGGVVDFITLSHWPTFNVADSCITIGAAMIIVALLFDRSAGPTPSADPSARTGVGDG
jgi:signal peptidase II